MSVLEGGGGPIVFSVLYSFVFVAVVAIVHLVWFIASYPFKKCFVVVVVLPF